ncbi:MAG: 50S ribosomal protein L4 [Verrucomicrobiota bacterium]|nr:50S ribosomal protein L4 [Verrucomicrobiota bacterium]
MAIKSKILTKEEALQAKFPLIENGIGTQALHDTVVAYQANRRTGTASTKTKGTVSFSGTKPWRQKGTGRARAGYRSSPLWRKGGVVFGPLPRDFSKTTPKSVKRLAFRKALSSRIMGGDVILVDVVLVSKPKTKDFLTVLKDLKVENHSTLFINDKIDETVIKASRNIPGIEIATAASVNAEQLLAYDKVVITNIAFGVVAERANK